MVKTLSWVAVAISTIGSLLVSPSFENVDGNGRGCPTNRPPKKGGDVGKQDLGSAVSGERTSSICFQSTQDCSSCGGNRHE